MTLTRRELSIAKASKRSASQRPDGNDKNNEKTHRKGGKRRNTSNNQRLKFNRTDASYKRSQTAATNAFCLFCLIYFCKSFISPSNQSFLRKAQSNNDPKSITSNISVLFPKPLSITSEFHYPPDTTRLLDEPDYGGLDIAFLEYNKSREIRENAFEKDYQTEEEEEEEENASYMDDFYFAFDDDKVREKGWKDYEDLHCHYTSWHRDFFPNCNTFHELDIIMSNEHNQYLDSGSYRSAFKIREGDDSEIVMKTIRYDKKKYNIELWETIRMDSLVMEKLTKSPRIADIHGHCAFSMMTEFLPYELEERSYYGTGFIEMDKVDEAQNNEFEEDVKLELALAMAEAIADLHGFEDGVIIHDDIQLCQFLFAKDFTLKLNDFNRAEIMLFDEEKNRFCRYKNGLGGGNLRAPEEYKDEPLNQKIDIWSYGTNVYTILTGLWVFFDEKDYYKVSLKVKDGTKPYIPDKYRNGTLPDRVLVQVLDRCFEYDPDDRADIFEIIQILRKGMDENKRISPDNK